MSDAPAATSRVYMLLGDPVAHSLSPAFQNAAIRAAGIDAAYVALRCAADAVPALVRALCHAGGGGNVTVPHKAIAALCLDSPSAAVRRTGACNTFWGEGTAVCGDNTDVEGFSRAAATLLPSLEGATALIAGAGGAAAAALCALLDAGAHSVTVFNRSPGRARQLVERLDPAGAIARTVTAAGELSGGDFDLVVNATVLGLRTDDSAAIDLATLGGVRAALDLVCRPGAATAFLRQARELGMPAADGTDMLLAQGAAAFRRWFRREPDLGVMRSALRESAAAQA